MMKSLRKHDGGWGWDGFNKFVVDAVPLLEKRMKFFLGRRSDFQVAWS